MFCMKKLLLSLAMAVGLVPAGFAQEKSYSIDFENAADNSSQKTATVTDVVSAETQKYVASLEGKEGMVYTGQNGMRIGQNKKPGEVTLTLSAEGSVTATKVEVEVSANKNAAKQTISVNGTATTLDASNTNASYKVCAAEITDGSLLAKITIANTRTGNASADQGFIYVHKITVYYTENSDVVPAPVISCEDNLVTITGKNGSEVYYTLDETTPTTTSTKYDAPFAITADVTVKAIAVVDGKSSDVASFEAKYEAPFEGFAAFLATDPAEGTEANIAGPITAIYLNGANLFVKDNVGGFMLLYQQGGFTDLTVENGTQFASVKGSYAPYYGLPEMKNVSFGAQSTGTAVEPAAVSIPDITKDKFNYYVKLTDVKIAYTGTSKTYEATDASDNKINLYNTVNLAEIPTGVGYTVIGFVGYRNEEVVITPVAFEGGQAMETVEAPVFSVASGRVAKGTEVTLSCATPEAQIFYTFGDAEPDSESSLYEEPFEITADTKINAIAYKDGMLASEVVSVSYIVLPEGAEVADFNFGDPTTLTPAVEAPEVGAGIDVNGKTFTTAKGVTLAVAEEGGEGANTIKPRIWNASGANAGKMDFRIYNGWSFTVTAPEGYLLSAIEMTRYTSQAFKLNASVGQVTANGDMASWEMPAAAPAAEATEATGKSVTFTATATNNIQTMKVIVVPDGQSGIESVVAADENAPVEYYNLQGVRVANPTTGLYIIKQGSKVSKAIIR